MLEFKNMPGILKKLIMDITYLHMPAGPAGLPLPPVPSAIAVLRIYPDLVDLPQFPPALEDLPAPGTPPKSPEYTQSVITTPPALTDTPSLPTGIIDTPEKIIMHQRLLIYILSTCYFWTYALSCDIRELPAARLPGDIMIGGIFPIHEGVANLLNHSYTDDFICTRIGIERMIEALAMIYTIEKINNLTLLPGITLGYEIYDSCADVLKATQATMRLIPETANINSSCSNTEIIPTVKAVIGEEFSEMSIAVSRILSIHFIPQVPFSKCSKPCSPGYSKKHSLISCCYECVLCTEGYYTPAVDMNECLKCPPNKWSNNGSSQCNERKIEYFYWENTFAVTLMTFALFGSLLVLIAALLFIKYKDTPAVRAAGGNYSYLMIISLLFSLASIWLFIGEPSNTICQFRQPLYGISFTLCVSCILIKSLRIILAFEFANKLVNITKLTYKPIVIITVLSGLQICNCILWLALKRPFYKEMYTIPHLIVLQCDEGSYIPFGIMLGYIGCLALTCFILAYKGRKLPEKYNEARSIAFSMFIYMFVWIIFIPVYMNTSGMYLSAVQIVAILASVYGVISCHLLPACYIILFKRKRNNSQAYPRETRLGVTLLDGADQDTQAKRASVHFKRAPRPHHRVPPPADGPRELAPENTGKMMKCDQLMQSHGSHEDFNCTGHNLLTKVIFFTYGMPQSTEELEDCIPMIPLLLRNVIKSYAMIYSIEEINNSSLLPGLKLGYAIYDSCSDVSKAIQSTIKLIPELNLLNKPPDCRTKVQHSVKAIIGEMNSEISIAISRILSLHSIPQISPASSAPNFSDKLRFPSFLRTVPSDTFQTQAIAKIIRKFGWNWVGIIASDDAYGYSALDLLNTFFKEEGICLAFTKTIPPNAEHPLMQIEIHSIIQELKNCSANVVVIFASGLSVIKIFNESIRLNISRIWIASDIWSMSREVANIPNIDKVGTILGLNFHARIISGFKDYLQNLHPSGDGEKNLIHEEYKNYRFGCTKEYSEYLECINKSLGYCFTSNSITHKSPLTCKNDDNIMLANDDYLVQNIEWSTTFSTSLAVKSIAYALKNLLCKNEICTKNSSVSPLELVSEIQNVKFHYDAKMFSFDKQGDFDNGYDIINWHTHNRKTEFKTLGYYDVVSSTFALNESLIFWNSKNNKIPASNCSKSCPPGYYKKHAFINCCYECIPCPEGYFSPNTVLLLHAMSHGEQCLKVPRPTGKFPDMDRCRPCFLTQWSYNGSSECKDKKIEYFQWENPFAIVLMVFAIVGVLFIFVSGCLFIIHSDNPAVKAAGRSYTNLISMALLFSLGSVFFFIGKPSDIICQIRQPLFGISFSLCVSCILNKSLQIFLACESVKGWKKNSIVAYQSVLIIGALVSIQISICILWTILGKPFYKQIYTIPQLIAQQCNVGSYVFFGIMLGYIGFLALTCLILAYKGRKVPVRHKEAKGITFSMLIYMFVWIIFIPIYLNTSGMYLPAVQIVAILASVYGVIFCQILPIFHRKTRNSCLCLDFRGSFHSHAFHRTSLIALFWYHAGKDPAGYAFVKSYLVSSLRKGDRLEEKLMEFFWNIKCHLVGYCPIGMPALEGFGGADRLVEFDIRTILNKEMAVNAFAMMYSIEEINNSTLLPGIKLGYAIYDSCSDVSKAIQSTIKLFPELNSLYNPPKCSSEIMPTVKAVVGEMNSEISIAISRILSLHSIPQFLMSWGTARQSVGSRQWMLDSLSRSPTTLAGIPGGGACCPKVSHLRIMACANQMGQAPCSRSPTAYNDSQCKVSNLREGWHSRYPEDSPREPLVNEIKKVKFPFFGHMFKFDKTGDFVNDYEIINCLIMWNTENNTNGICLAPTPERAPRRVNEETDSIFKPNGTDDHTSRLKQYRARPCNQGTMRQPSTVVYICKCEVSRSVCPGPKRRLLFTKSWYPQRTHLADMDRCIPCGYNQWSSNGSSRCKDREIEFFNWKDPFAITLVAFATFGCILVLATVYFYIKDLNNSAVKATGRKYNYLIIISLLFSLSSTYLFIGNPSNVVCQIRQPLYGISFTVCVSSLLIKSLMYNLPYKPIKTVKYTLINKPPIIIGALTIIQIVICIIWLTTKRPFQTTIYSIPEILVLQCDEGSYIFFSIMLAYIGLISLVCFILAYKKKKLPEKRYNARGISFTMLSYMFVWVIFIPIYMNTSGMYLPAVEVVAIIASVYGVIFCCLLPECHSILIRNNQRENTQEPRLSVLQTNLDLSALNANAMICEVNYSIQERKESTNGIILLRRRRRSI
ncbi:G- coupled receptor family C group 6 member A-like [Pelobates cultripes]|uniref:G- coupled receptor family C group 6 member A-like n=1 Tax=Pelobates cultripes TaxID=61616 RepID=A0AAD1RFQ3_PELCU|nr:G- coupled receptor family C group 6 member A-like [Pelobates cultripes]